LNIDFLEAKNKELHDEIIIEKNENSLLIGNIQSIR